jgi:hypothetical protein
VTTDMILERHFDPPLTVADVHARVRESDWCYAQHKVAWRASFLAVDGHKMICWFAAPDLESTRNALRSSGADASRLWLGTVHRAAAPVVPNVLVERRFAQPVAFEDVQARELAAGWCLQAHRVRFAQSFFSVDRTRMLCLYQAPDAESVRLAQREAALPVDKVWAFERIDPDTIAASSPG